MKTQKELINKITKQTQLIREEHSELSKLLDEMPLTMPNEDDPQMTIEKLEEYYEALRLMVQNQQK
ncbi:MAG: hypothetical protein ABJG41_19500 [Cyclobacteriaceae bacterium]